MEYELIMIYSKCRWGYYADDLETDSGEMSFEGFPQNDFSHLGRGEAKSELLFT